MANRGYSLLWCAGFSLRWLLLLRSTGSRRTGFSSCGSRGLECRLSNCGTWAYLLRSMWDLPRPGLEPVSPALAGRFLTTAPPEKSLVIVNFKSMNLHLRKSSIIYHEFRFIIFCYYSQPSWNCCFDISYFTQDLFRRVAAVFVAYTLVINVYFFISQSTAGAFVILNFKVKYFKWCPSTWKKWTIDIGVDVWRTVCVCIFVIFYVYFNSFCYIYLSANKINTRRILHDGKWQSFNWQ